jgi:hypothetical protein
VSTSARSVITPDPNISVEELGVPLKIAMIETFRKPSPLTTSTACATWSSTVPTTILERGMWQMEFQRSTPREKAYPHGDLEATSSIATS